MRVAQIYYRKDFAGHLTERMAASILFNTRMIM